MNPPCHQNPNLHQTSPQISILLTDGCGRCKRLKKKDETPFLKTPFHVTGDWVAYCEWRARFFFPETLVVHDAGTKCEGLQLKDEQP